MPHNTKFGSKMFGGLEDNIWTNINILTLRLMMMSHLTEFRCQGINSSENIVERVIFESYELSP